MSLNLLEKKERIHNHPVFLEKNKSFIQHTLSNTYTAQEYIESRWDIPGALYLLDYKPEIVQHKVLLEKILKTERIENMTLEWIWSQGYVVQISDICLKLKNQDSSTDFIKELQNYKTIEQLYNQYMGNQSYFKIPWLQRHLCDRHTIAMEYIPWFTLAHHFILKEKKIKEKELIDTIESHKEYDDISHICSRLWDNYDHIFDKLKDHELRTILLYLWIKEEEIENISHLDTEFLIEYSINNKVVDNTRKVYKERKTYLSKNGIKEIDDHWENLKIHNNILYGMDFGNIIFSKIKY